MKTRTMTPVIGILVGLTLAACSAAANPNSPNTGGASTPALAPTDTPLPGGGASPVAIKIQGFAFDPPSITVKAGTTVQWTNEDSASHSVTSDTGIWDSGNFANGESFTRVFDTPGTYAYHCGVHPSMKGTIIVTS
jgi:plastocyanin